MPSDPLELPATADQLRRLSKAGYLDRAALERAFVLTGHVPGRGAWLQFINTVLLLLGVAFTLSGVVFFFAYNWSALHRFLKFGLIQAAILAVAALAFSQGLGRLMGKVALLAAAILVGVLLAIYGQVYQTGAHSYQLFVSWAVLIAGWVAIGAFVPLWALLLVLMNLGLALYWEQRLTYGSAAMFDALTFLNAGWLFVWEYARSRGLDWIKPRWFPRLVVLATFVLLVIPNLQLILFAESYPDDPALLLAPLLFAGFSLFTIVYYRATRDLLNLTVCAFALIVVLTSAVSRVFGDGFGWFLVLSLLVLGQAAVAVNLLRRVSHAWEKGI